MTTFNKNDINTLEEAKEYAYYINGKLTDQEKDIFNSSLLQPNGTLDVSFLQDTAELLNNWKAGKDKVKTEKMGLSTEGHALLIALLKEQKGNSVPYQIINDLENNQPVDKVISQFEDILFSKTDAIFEEQTKAKLIVLVNVKEERNKKLQEINKLGELNIQEEQDENSIQAQIEIPPEVKK